MQLTCPICERQLGKNETLEIGHDARGTLIVRHIVPESVEHRRSDEDDLEFYLRIKSAGPLAPGRGRSICGLAGFKHFEVSKSAWKRDHAA